MARFAENNDIPVVKFKKGIRKAAVMEPLLRRAAQAGRPRVVAIGWAQEFQLVWGARKRDTDPAKPPQFSFAKAERLVTCYYFYVWDEFWGAYADRPDMPRRAVLSWSGGGSPVPGAALSSRWLALVRGYRGRPGGCRASAWRGPVL